MLYALINFFIISSVIHLHTRMNEVNSSSEVWRGTPLQSLTSVIHPCTRMNLSRQRHMLPRTFVLFFCYICGKILTNNTLCKKKKENTFLV